jgi:hypothetical protein
VSRDCVTARVGDVETDKRIYGKVRALVSVVVATWVVNDRRAPLTVVFVDTLRQS